MTVTRDIVVDLLPLYVSGEASADSRAAVQHFIEQDPSLRALAAALQQDLPPAEPVPAHVETEAVNRTRRAIARRSWTLGLALLCTLLPLAVVFRSGEVTFFMLRDQPQSMWAWPAAALLWLNYLWLTRRLKTAGLS